MGINYTRPPAGHPTAGFPTQPAVAPAFPTQPAAPAQPAAPPAPPQAAAPAPGAPAAFAQTAAFAAQPGAPAVAQAGSASRAGLDAAIAACPPDVQEELTGPCARALALLREHLPAAEEVRHVCSGAVDWTRSPINSVFAVTSRRLLFVAPAPQVLTFDLTTVESTQCTTNIFHLTADSSKYQLGISRSHGRQFEQQTSVAVAVARLARG